MANCTKRKKSENSLKYYTKFNKHTFILYLNFLQSFKMIGSKVLGVSAGQGTHHIYNIDVKMTKFIKWNRWEKFTQILYKTNKKKLINTFFKAGFNYNRFKVFLSITLTNTLKNQLYIEKSRVNTCADPE